MPRRRNDIVISAIADVQRALRELEELREEMDGIKNGSQKANKGLSTLTKGVVSFVSAAALVEGARIATDLAKIGAEAIDVSNAFNRLEGSTELLNKMRDNVRKTVPDIELMRSALIGIDLGGTNDQLKVFTEFARFESVRKGGNTLRLLENIMSGVFRGSTELLDNFGFALQEVNAEIERQAAAQGKNANALSTVERRTLLIASVTKLMRDRMAAAGNIATTSAEKIRANAAAVENLKVRIGEFLVDVGDGFINFFGRAVVGVNKLLDSMGVGGAKRVEELSNEFGNVKESIQGQLGVIDKLTTRYRDLKSITKPSEEQQRELNGVIQQLAELVPGAITGINRYGDALDINLNSVKAFTEAQRDMLKFEEAKNLERLKNQLSDSSGAFSQANDDIDKYQKRLDKVTASKDKFVTLTREELKEFDITNQLNLEDDYVESAETFVKRLQARISELRLDALAATGELDSMARVVSKFFDLENKTPELLSRELKISEQLAGELIDRFSELRQKDKAEAEKIAADKKKKAEALASQAAQEESIRNAKAVKSQVAAAKLKQRLDEIELSASLSKYDKMREAVTARYEAEITIARTKSTELAALKQQELDNQLALINQQEQAEIDAATVTLQQKLALDGIELDTSLGKYEQEKAALRERYAVEIAEARKVSEELAELKQQELDNALKKVDLKALNESLKAQFKLDINLGDTETEVLASFQRMMDALNNFYAEQLALAAGNADQLKLIEAAKTEDIAQLNQELAETLADIYVQDMINRNGILSGMEAAYDTFAANILDTEKTGAEKRMEIFMNFYDALKNAIFDALKTQIIASLKDTAFYKSQVAAKTAIDNAAAGQKAAHDNAEIARSGAKAAANTSEAASGFMAAHAKIPFVGLALALGFIATMMATLKGLKGKATGGRVRRDDLTDSPFTPAGDDGIAGLKIGEDVMTVGEVARYGHILDAIHAGRPLPLVQAAFQAAMPGPLTPPPIAPGVFMPGGGFGAGMVQQMETVRQVPVHVKTELELIQASGAKVRAHHIQVEDDILEPHRNQKNRQRRSSTEGLF